MPHQWTSKLQEAPEKSGASLPYRQRRDVLQLWPHSSLTAPGFVWFIAITAVALCLPLIPLLGTFALWGLLPFLLLALFGVWYGIRRNQRDMMLHEILVLDDEQITLTRHNPRHSDQHWQANPYWVELRLHPSKGPVENYITLRGSDREVELGAFLSPEERVEVYRELDEKLRLHSRA